MGFKSSVEVLERLQSPDNIIYHEHHLGKTKGAKDIPMPIKEVIAVVAQEDKLDDVAQAFGISRREVGYLKAGETSSGPNETLKAAVDAKRLDAADKAIDILLTSLEIIPTKLKGAKLKELSGVAKDMSVVAEAMRKKGLLEDSQQVSFHLHVPQQKELKDYEIVDVE